MSYCVADTAICLVQRLARNVNCKVSDVVVPFLNHMSTGLLGAIVGLAIAVVFTWKFLRTPPARECRRAPKRSALPSGNDSVSSGVAAVAEDTPTVPNLRDSDVIQENNSPYESYMPRRKTEEANLTYVECLLYTFHHLAHKTPNSTNSLCGYKIVTGQPSDRLGEDFSDIYKDFTERLNSVEEIVRVAMKKLTQGMADHNKAISAAKTEDEKANSKAEQQKATIALRVCNNILIMTQPLHAKSPSFIGDNNKISPSWKEQKKVTPAAIAGAKRSGGPSNVTGMSTPSKIARGGGGMQNQLVNRALEGLSHGGRSNGRGKGFGGRGRGRGYR